MSTDKERERKLRRISIIEFAVNLLSYGQNMLTLISLLKLMKRILTVMCWFEVKVPIVYVLIYGDRCL